MRYKVWLQFQENYFFLRTAGTLQNTHIKKMLTYWVYCLGLHEWHMCRFKKMVQSVSYNLVAEVLNWYGPYNGKTPWTCVLDREASVGASWQQYKCLYWLWVFFLWPHLLALTPPWGASQDHPHHAKTCQLDIWGASQWVLVTQSSLMILFIHLIWLALRVL